jgi:hypothetical protein
VSHFCCLSFVTDPNTFKAVKIAQCGNGVKEGNEQCDCGTEEECKSDPCCNVGCKLKPSAKCSDRNSDCCNKCQIKPKGAVCRQKRSECDMGETCSGQSPECPKDNFVGVFYCQLMCSILCCPKDPLTNL